MIRFLEAILAHNGYDCGVHTLEFVAVKASVIELILGDDFSAVGVVDYTKLVHFFLDCLWGLAKEDFLNNGINKERSILGKGLSILLFDRFFEGLSYFCLENRVSKLDIFFDSIFCFFKFLFLLAKNFKQAI